MKFDLNRNLIHTYFEVSDTFSNGHHPTTGLMAHHHWLLHNEISDIPFRPEMDVTATDADRLHHQQHLCNGPITSEALQMQGVHCTIAYMCEQAPNQVRSRDAVGAWSRLYGLITYLLFQAAELASLPALHEMER